MRPTNLLFPVIAVLVAIITTHFLPKKNLPTLSEQRFNSIDGLRGYLAFFVFLHHSCIWYFYLHTGKWQVPPSRLFTHFGQTSVALFFMITSFLFFTKLLNSKQNGVDWNKLYISRILRLVPLYLFAMFVVFSIVAYMSNGVLIDSPFGLLKGIIKWLSFTVLGDADLNGVKSTSLIIAGVTWSLPYEWFFYFSLPVFALFLKVKVPFVYALFGCLSLVAFYFWGPQWYHLLAFLGGIIASYLIRNKVIASYSQSVIGTRVFIACFVLLLFLYSSPYSTFPMFLLFMAFTVIASGNTFGGIFTHKISRTLGEMAYSIYLLHGIILFVIFKFILGFSFAQSLTAPEYWGIIILIIPVLICTCYLTFNFIEQVAMKQTNKVTTFLFKKY